MRSLRPIVWLLRKEWRELWASRAWWVLLTLTGPLVGVSFIGAVRTYAEVSAGAAGTAGVFSPLDGIWMPTFGAYEIVATFLLPFVAIRLIAGDRQSGALKIELQRPLSPVVRVGAKAAVLLAGWLVALLPAAAAIALWKSYGGATYAPEIGVVIAGHLLNAAVTIALASAAASIAEHPATAAILTLAFTIGTWVIAFAAAIEGGAWQALARFTPMALIASFQHGLVDMGVTLVGATVAAAGFGLAAVWMRLGVSLRVRTLESCALVAGAIALSGAFTLVHGHWDASEGRRNSFSEPAEEALAAIRGPLVIDAHLAPADGRRDDLERHAFAKLRRAMPGVKIRYESETSIGLYEQAAASYGEIDYELGGRRAVSRITTEEGVLETVFSLVGVTPPDDVDAPYFGHPLTARPVGAATVFYAVWPAAVAGFAFLAFRRHP